ncbi:SDR family NAD(P)-dependent oxidoreductase [Oricola sp.]|uniref:SDR family NAD(P)-dependent oxidoreductase n=1 Tax=Oricola sp. TaxID=1979950 RepID=UPI000C8E8E14|nr:3-hydroxyacyl-CoA dehydrogenase [Ahrensia sp.]|tara:strand:+ start:15612 stop:16373 length:762 start_codon:yes stop_codon:yes gene_type:complete
MDDLFGRHAVVTGAGSGLGEAIALSLAENGARVTAMGRRREPLEALARRNSRIVAVEADVTNGESFAAAIQKAVDANDMIDIVVANAGMADSEPFKKMTEAHFRSIVDVNLVGVFNTFRACFDKMIHGPNGRLIAISSIAGLHGHPYMSAYCASKHGVIGLVRALAMEVAKTGVTVNAICPGYTETPMLTHTIENIMEKTGRTREEAEAPILSTNPQGRFIKPEEVAATALWLCSSGAASVNGQAIEMSGGGS